MQDDKTRSAGTSCHQNKIFFAETPQPDLYQEPATGIPSCHALLPCVESSDFIACTQIKTKKHGDLNMKRIVILSCIALMSLMLLTGCNQQAEVKIGVVDEAAAFKDNKAAASAMAYLQELGAPLQKKAEEAYKAMQAEQTEENVSAYKAAMGELQNVMNGEQQRIVALIDQKFNETLDAYRTEKGLVLILSKESVISSADTIDITSDIVAAMNDITLDFKVADQKEAAPEVSTTEAPATETPATEAPATKDKE
jgi:outer membrane protein